VDSWRVVAVVAGGCKLQKSKKLNSRRGKVENFIICSLKFVDCRSVKCLLELYCDILLVYRDLYKIIS